MGGSTKTTDQKQSETVQPQTPSAVRDPIFNYYSGVDNYANADPNSFVTPINDIQRSAFNNTGGLFGSSPAYGAAANIAANVGTSDPLKAQQAGMTNLVAPGGAGSQGYNAAGMMDNFSRYLDPTTNALVNTTLSDFDANAAQKKAAQRARYAAAVAFGGSRSAIGEGLLDSELARARASADAQLRSNAWNQAGNWAQFDTTGTNNARQFGANASNQASLNNAQLASQQAMAQQAQANQQAQFNAQQANQMALAQQQAQLDAARALAGIGGSAADTYRADLSAQLGAGNNLYSLDNTATQAPITQLQTIAGLLNPGGVVQTQTGQIANSDTTGQQKTNPGALNTVLGIGSLLAAPFTGGASLMGAGGLLGGGGMSPGAISSTNWGGMFNV